LAPEPEVLALIQQPGYQHMAELLRTQGYRVQVSGVPSAATPQLSFGQQPRPEVEYQAAANYQQTLAQVVDRISQTAFGIAAKAGERAGAQFALENPLTQEQLQAMSRGDMSTVDLGSPMNVFSSMVRKVRAAELSAHMEAEARQEMVSIYNDAVAGKVNTETAKGRIEGLLNAGGSTLGQVDPDAAYKYRASIAAAGSKVIDEIGKVELKRRAIANEQKLTTDYRNTMTLISSYMSGTTPINPKTGQEWDLMQIIGAEKQRFLAGALALGGMPAMESYTAQFDKDVRAAQISVLTRELTKDEYYLNPTETIRRIYGGDLNDARQAIGNLVVTDPEAVKGLAANFRTMVSDRRAQRQDEINAEKEANNAAANNLLIEYFSPGATPSRKRAIALQVASMRMFTIEQLEKFLDPSAAKGDPYAQASLEFAISQGQITQPAQLREAANRAGMNGQQFLELNRKLIQGINEEQRQAERYIRDVSGIPDVRGVFVGRNDQHKLDKASRLKEILEESADQFRSANPGVAVPWQQLARDAETRYSQLDGANAKKQQARRQLDNFVADLRKKNKRLPESFAIDAETNVDDLIRAGIIKEDQAAYIRSRVNTLREVSQ